MNSASCCIRVRISGEHWRTSNLQDLQERFSISKKERRENTGAEMEKNEEEMKDQLALLRKLAKGVVWCSVYTRVCLRRMFVGSCAYMHSAFWSSSLFFYFIVIIIPAAPFSLFLSVWRKVEGIRMAIAPGM